LMAMRGFKAKFRAFREFGQMPLLLENVAKI
jgi:hypothetical protein